MKDKFILIRTSPGGTEQVIGEPMTEKEADNFRKAHDGGIGSQCGFRYSVRPLRINF